MTSHSNSVKPPTNVNEVTPITPTNTTPPVAAATTTANTNKAIPNPINTPAPINTNTASPSTITPPPALPNQNKDQDRLASSSNNPIVSQSSVVPSPQTIPIEPSTESGSSSTLSDTTTHDKNALPVVAVVIIAIVGGIIGLFILYRIYRRLFYKFQKHRSSNIPPPTTTNNTSTIIPTYGYNHSPVSQMTSTNHFGSTRALSQYHSKASLARHSIYYTNPGPKYHHVEAEASDLGTYSMLAPPPHSGQSNQTAERYETQSMSSLLPSHDGSNKTSPTTQNLNHELTIALDSASEDSRQILLGPPSIQSGRVSPLPVNPLLVTKDHSTLSTNTLKQATRRQSINQHNNSRNPSTDFGPSMMDHRMSTYAGQQQTRSNSRTSVYGGQQSRSNSRMSVYGGLQSRSNSRMSTSVGLPHLTKPRYQLTLPTPLSKPDLFVNQSPQPSMAFDSQIGSNPHINEFDINSFTQQQHHYQNDDHYGSIPLHSQIGSISGDDDEFVNPQPSDQGNSLGGNGTRIHRDPAAGTSPLDLLKIQFAHQQSL